MADRALRVLFWMQSSREIPGGHRVQFERTAEAVGDTGADVQVSTEPNPSFGNVDVVHTFGVDAAGIRAARDHGCRVAVSTIYNPIRFTHGLDRTTRRSRVLRRSRSIAVGALAAAGGREIERADRVLARITAMRLAYESADLLLPNASGELRDIRADLGVSTRAVIVPNALDARIFLASEPPGRESRRGVLCVGRLEPHKNQLLLAHVCRELDLPLTLVGPEHPHHKGYADSCLAAYPRLRWIREVGQEALVAHYDEAAVHVLCSFFETTGLSSLEAAARGCAVVTTNRGYTSEYFGVDADYCDPADPTSVRTAIESALARSPAGVLRERIRRSYTWDATARATMAAYGLLAAPGGRRG